MKLPSSPKRFFLFLGMMVLGIGGGLLLVPALVDNIYALQVLQASFSTDSELRTRVKNLWEQRAQTVCKDNWFLSQMVSPEERLPVYSALLKCSPTYWPLIATMNPTSPTLAAQAVEQYPDNAEMWLWLAEAQYSISPKIALSTYLRVVQLDEQNGRAWCRIGAIYRDHKNDVDQALHAYDHCCINGDPGSNGCYNAGLIAEKQGNPTLALKYYRLSRYSVATQRATELEKQLDSPK